MSYEQRKELKTQYMESNKIRQAFLDFFAGKDHVIVPSTPMVVKNDPTLMFTNAGMNQFKDIFLGNIPRPYPGPRYAEVPARVGQAQRPGGVGHDTYHHTMFEMLGNWSFGDYFKKEAIGWAWELLTGVYGLDKSRMYATVFEGSPEEGCRSTRRPTTSGCNTCLRITSSAATSTTTSGRWAT